MLAKIHTYALLGIDAYGITIECDISNGLPQFTIVGLPDNAVKESRERIRSALKHSGFLLPDSRITINLAPANTKKEGPIFDLPIALSILVAMEAIPQDLLNNTACIGELSLDGSIKPVYGILPMVLKAKSDGQQSFIAPIANLSCAKLVDNIRINGISSLSHCLNALLSKEPFIHECSQPLTSSPAFKSPDFAHVKGQYHVKRGLEIAASGGHNALMIGPPGSGKTMLARCLPSILPDLTYAESLELTHIYSTIEQHQPIDRLITQRPLRSPHHSASSVSLIGGGSTVKPGEVTLAHHGILFLDELPEFSRHSLEALRQPLEEGFVTIARAKNTLRFPAKFMLIAAMNPCPCGQLGNPYQPCRCSPQTINQYQQRISGPLLDRIDIKLQTPALRGDDIYQNNSVTEDSATIRQRCMAARARQHQRFAHEPFSCNAHMDHQALRKYCRLNTAGEEMLRNAVNQFHLSMRSHDRIIKVARTIADLANMENINLEHLQEALSYRWVSQ